MPLPEPRPEEDKNAFVARCIADTNARGEFPDMVQRVAVCINQYEKK
jgi:hypothetical protein